MDVLEFIKFLTTQRALKEGTINNHRLRIEMFLRWLEGKEINKQNLQSFFYSIKDKNGGTYNAFLSTLRLVDLYFENIGTPKFLMKGYQSKEYTPDPIQILSIEDTQKLLSTHITFKQRHVEWEKLDEFYLSFTRFLYFTACRVQEGIKLKVKYYDPGTHAIYFVKTKTSRNRRVYIEDKELQQILHKAMVGKSPDDYLFLTPSGKPICWQMCWDNLKKRSRTAEIMEIHPHTLRHTQASHLYKAGVPLEMVSLILGHKNVGVTFNTYVHVADESIKQAFTRSPLIQQEVSPTEKIKDIKKTLDSLRIDQDERLKEFYKDLQMVFIKYS